MKNTIQSEFYQLHYAKLWIGILIEFTILAAVSVDSLVRIFRDGLTIEINYHTNLIIQACRSYAFSSFIPIVAVLPFGSVYIDELKNKFSYYLLIRCGYSKYICSKILVCFLSGGIVIAGGVFSAWIVAFNIFYPLEMQTSTAGGLNDSSLGYLLEIAMLQFLCGGFWSIVGMAMSTIVESKYISYATPFVFFYLLVILYERYFSDLFIIYPVVWTDPAAWPFGCWGAAIFLLEMTLIFAILFAFRAGRRLQQL